MSSVKRISDEAAAAIAACAASCWDCPAAADCTPDCVVNLVEQLFADITALAMYTRAIQKVLEEDVMSGDASHTIVSVSRLIDQMLPLLPKEKTWTQ